RPRARTSSAGHPSPLITASSPTGLTPVRRLSGLTSASQPTPIDDRWPPQPAHHSVLTHWTPTSPSAPPSQASVPASSPSESIRHRPPSPLIPLHIHPSNPIIDTQKASSFPGTHSAPGTSASC